MSAPLPAVASLRLVTFTTLKTLVFPALGLRSVKFKILPAWRKIASCRRAFST
jgi:hypothetical protein